MGIHRRHDTVWATLLELKRGESKLQNTGITRYIPWKQTFLVCVINPVYRRSMSNVYLLFMRSGAMGCARAAQGHWACRVQREKAQEKMVSPGDMPTKKLPF